MYYDKEKGGIGPAEGGSGGGGEVVGAMGPLFNLFLFFI